MQKCIPCGDAFCATCFADSHSTGRKKLHEFTKIADVIKIVRDDGMRICIECNDLEATRLCVNCIDDFCDTCFMNRHQKGKRAEHQWKRLKSMEDRRLRAEKRAEKKRAKLRSKIAARSGWQEYVGRTLCWCTAVVSRMVSSVGSSLSSQLPICSGCGKEGGAEEDGGCVFVADTLTTSSSGPTSSTPTARCVPD